MELKVWVEGIQRIVCGVTEKTTCQVKLIYLILELKGSGELSVTGIFSCCISSNMFMFMGSLDLLQLGFVCWEKGWYGGGPTTRPDSTLPAFSRCFLPNPDYGPRASHCRLHHITAGYTPTLHTSPQNCMIHSNTALGLRYSPPLHATPQNCMLSPNTARYTPSLHSTYNQQL